MESKRTTKHTVEFSPRGEWKEYWDEFEAAMKQRLEAGFRAYGDSAFDRSTSSLVKEIDEEVLDVCGWAYLVRRRLQDIEDQVEIMERLISKISHVDPTTGCWVWGAAVAQSGGGYGILRVNGKNMSAHRLIYKYMRGGIPKDLVVRHTCDNRLCINPGHLLLGTPADNVRDRDERNRTAVGEQTNKAKLTVEQVKEIRRLADEDGWTYAALGRKFGVTYQCIRSVVIRNTWDHVKE